MHSKLRLTIWQLQIFKVSKTQLLNVKFPTCKDRIWKSSNSQFSNLQSFIALSFPISIISLLEVSILKLRNIKFSKRWEYALLNKSPNLSILKEIFCSTLPIYTNAFSISTNLVSIPKMSAIFFHRNVPYTPPKQTKSAMSYFPLASKA